MGWNCNLQRLSYARIFRALLLGEKELFFEKQVKITGFKVFCAGSFSWQLLRHWCGDWKTTF